MLQHLRCLFIVLLLVPGIAGWAQPGKGIIKGKVTSGGRPVPFVNVVLKGTTTGTTTDAAGHYLLQNVPLGEHTVLMSGLGYESVAYAVEVKDNQPVYLNAALRETAAALSEVVVTGTLKEVSRLDSPVPVEVYTPQYFKKNPTPVLFEALQIVNGVRPQLNCNICNTGDIHINGLEGPYTMVLIDGMPIVSGLSTVYGLNGIPNSLVERIEIVRAGLHAVRLGSRRRTDQRDHQESLQGSLRVGRCFWHELAGNECRPGPENKSGESRVAAWPQLLQLQQPN